MKKYSTKFKLKVVEYYINNYYSYHDVARYFDIPNHKSVEEWVKKYQIIKFAFYYIYIKTFALYIILTLSY